MGIIERLGVESNDVFSPRKLLVMWFVQLSTPSFVRDWVEA